MSLHRSVFAVYRKLLRTRMQVFAGDSLALNSARSRIRVEFRKNQDITSVSDIEKWVKIANETADYMKIGVVQAHQSGPGIYKLNITKDTHLHDSVPLKKPLDINLKDYKLPDHKEKPGKSWTLTRICQKVPAACAAHS